MFQGLQKVANGIAETMNSVNPLVDDFGKKHQEMMECLLDNGFKPEEVTSFVDVDRAQFIDELKIELKARERMSRKKK